MGVPSSRLLYKIPATWAGVEAVRRLEVEGLACHVVDVYSFEQGAAAIQARASVVNVCFGRLRDWARMNPGYPFDLDGPREDSGAGRTCDPGLKLARKLYAFAHRQKGGKVSRLVASGLRRVEDAADLAGFDGALAYSPNPSCDPGAGLRHIRSNSALKLFSPSLCATLAIRYPVLVVPPKLMKELEAMPASEAKSLYGPGLSPDAVAAAHFAEEEAHTVTQAHLERVLAKALGRPAGELLSASVNAKVADGERVAAILSKFAPVNL